MRSFAFQMAVPLGTLQSKKRIIILSPDYIPAADLPLPALRISCALIIVAKGLRALDGASVPKRYSSRAKVVTQFLQGVQAERIKAVLITESRHFVGYNISGLGVFRGAH